MRLRAPGLVGQKPAPDRRRYEGTPVTYLVSLISAGALACFLAAGIRSLSRSRRLPPTRHPRRVRIDTVG
jgi:hypothetical protein